MDTSSRMSRADLAGMLPANHRNILIDLGCGARKREGHIGIDRAKLDGVDIVCDIEKGLPLEDNSIDGLYSNFLFEHVGQPIFLFEEVHRVCRTGATVEIRVPYYQSVTQYKDPTHKSVITPETIRYFSKDTWYGSDYGIKANFTTLNVQYEYLSPFSSFSRLRYVLLRPILYPVRAFARRYLWNVVHSVTITMEVVK